MGPGLNGTGGTVGLYTLNGTSTQWNWDTMGLVHNRPGTQKDLHTLGLDAMNARGTQFDWDAMGLIYYETVHNKRYNRTVHCGTVHNEWD